MSLLSVVLAIFSSSIIVLTSNGQFLGCAIIVFSERYDRYILYTFIIYRVGARGGVVVKALRYKPVGRGFDSR